MEQQLAQLGDGISDIGAGIFFAALALAISWFHIGRMRWRRPIVELEELETLKEKNVISDKEYDKLRSKLIKRF